MPAASNRFREHNRRQAGATEPPKAKHLAPKPPEKWHWRTIAKVFGKKAVCRLRGHGTLSPYYVRDAYTATGTEIGAMCDYCATMGPRVHLEGSKPHGKVRRRSGTYNLPMPDDQRRGIIENIKSRLSPWNP